MPLSMYHHLHNSTTTFTSFASNTINTTILAVTNCAHFVVYKASNHACKTLVIIISSTLKNTTIIVRNILFINTCFLLILNFYILYSSINLRIIIIEVMAWCKHWFYIVWFEDLENVNIFLGHQLELFQILDFFFNQPLIFPCPFSFHFTFANIISLGVLIIFFWSLSLISRMVHIMMENWKPCS